MQTQAFQLVKNGEASQAFALNTVQLPALESDDIHIKVSAFGLNYADVMARNGLYKEAPPLPCVLGYEVVGEIVAVGKDVDASEVGKRVVAFCRFGGYAQDVITKSYAYAPIGDLDTGKALCLATQYVTAYYMCNYVNTARKGERALIHAAAGGVGTALLQLLKLQGVETYAKTSSRKKEAYLKAQGADHIIYYTEGDYAELVEKELNGERLDITYNPVAGSTFKKDFALLGSGGRLILFGGSERSGKKWGILSTLNFVRKMGIVIPIGLMMRSKNILGVNMLKVADNKPHVIQHCLTELVSLLKDDKIDPQVGGSYTSSQLAEAHAELESGRTIGKLIVNWSID